MEKLPPGFLSLGSGSAEFSFPEVPRSMEKLPPGFLSLGSGSAEFSFPDVPRSMEKLSPGFLSLGNERAEFSFPEVPRSMEKLTPSFLSLGSRSAGFSFLDLLGTHRAPAQLPDEIIEKIFLCIPPDEHEHLLCAALVCKHWARLLASDGFRRQYRERYRTPLLLGFLGNLIDTGGYARFIPTRAFRPVRPDCPDYRALDARHGRVLLNRIARCSDVFQGVEATLIVWDPITDEQWPLPPLLRDQPVHNWTAAVLCATPGNVVLGTCDHLGCHPGNFHVIFVGIDKKEMFASVYSSDSATWSEVTSANLPYDHLNEEVVPALAGNALYFVFQMGMTMLKYDLATRVMFVIPTPISWYLHRVVPMAMDDGGLGLAEVDLQSNLILWSIDGNVGQWVVSRHIELWTLLPAHVVAFFVIAVADAVGIIFIYTNDGVYTFDLNSGQVTKVFSNGFYAIVPFVSFYTPVLRSALPGEGPSASASSGALGRNNMLTRLK